MIASKNNQIPKLVTTLAVGLAACCSSVAQSSDALLDKLVEKGILSVKEANDLKEETDKDFTKAYSIKSGMPDWVQSLKFNGDFRARFEEIAQDNGADAAHVQTRDRFRYRARLGATALLSDNFEVGLRLGSGEDNSTKGQLGGDPLSPNTTLNNNASRKFLFIDLAYAKYTPGTWGEFQVGKMQNAFYATPMVFDPDYNPEGAQEKLTWTINDKHSISGTAGQWVVSESGTASDTYLFVEQLDWTAKWHKKFSTRLAAMMYNFAAQNKLSGDVHTIENAQNGTPAVGFGTGASGAFQNGTFVPYGAQNFNPIIGHAEATYNLDSFPCYKGEFPITAFGEYAINPGANGRFAGPAAVHQPYSGDQNEAWSAGVVLGSAKAKGNWQVSYAYRNIETASLWKGLVDSDFGFAGTGGTDVRGHVINATYKVLNPLSLGFTYFLTEQINNSPGHLNQQQRFQADMLWSF